MNYSINHTVNKDSTLTIVITFPNESLKNAFFGSNNFKSAQFTKNRESITFDKGLLINLPEEEKDLVKRRSHLKFLKVTFVGEGINPFNSTIITY
jgi:hypothetical protein